MVYLFDGFSVRHLVTVVVVIPWVVARAGVAAGTSVVALLVVGIITISGTFVAVVSIVGAAVAIKWMLIVEVVSIAGAVVIVVVTVIGTSVGIVGSQVNIVRTAVVTGRTPVASGWALVLAVGSSKISVGWIVTVVMVTWWTASRVSSVASVGRHYGWTD